LRREHAATIAAMPIAAFDPSAGVSQLAEAIMRIIRDGA
jgi:hypothetical protein